MTYFVYLVASKKDGVLYLGVTNDLARRIHEHKSKATPGFTSRYNVALLVWFELYDNPINAITREKEIKKWKRAWKVVLIEKENPDWRDLYDDVAQSKPSRDELAEIPGSQPARAAAPRNDVL